MSGSPNAAEAEGVVVVSKVKVKREIKTIVENLETILGDLKDVAKELKEVNEPGGKKHLSYRSSPPCVVLFGL